MSKEITRRKFIEDVTKYCGAGIAAMGLLRTTRAHADVDDLDTPAHEGIWRMRDSQLKQYGEFIKNAPLPKGPCPDCKGTGITQNKVCARCTGTGEIVTYDLKNSETMINEGKPVEWSHLHQNWYAEGSKSLVGLIMATPLDKDLKGDIKKVMKLVGGFGKSLKKSDKILIKPNMNTAEPWPQGGTDPEFLKALILVLKDEGYQNISVADACGPWGPTERVIKKVGYDAVCRETNTALKDWDKGKWMNIRNAKAEFLGKMGGGDGTVGYPEDLRNYDKVIYTPIMKTHFLGGITQSLKLSVGILHRADRGDHLHAFNHIFTAEQAAEINLPFRPDLIIMDGRRSLISGGPSHGEQVKPGMILASGDQVANDVMGIKILQEWYPNMAANKIGMYAWHQKQILQAVKQGIGYAKKDEDLKLVLG
jgi:uncharacterized protein (DUF362 family)